MCPEGVPRAVDRRDKAIGKVALFEATSQEFAQLVPPGLADFFMEVLASDNGELLRLGCDEYEQVIVIFRRPRAQLAKLLGRGGERIFDAAMSDENHDVAGSAFLRGLDRLMNAVVFKCA